jgi:uncharacterized protein (TIRG00374 family)
LNLAKPFLVVIILIAIYVVFLFFSDVEKTLSTLVSIDKRFLVGGIALWLIGLFVRVIRWHYFLKSITTTIPFVRSSLYFISGFAFILSPARVGEMLKSPLIKRDYNIPISKTAPIVLVERFYDLLAVTIIIAIGIVFTKINSTVALIPIGIIILIILLIRNKNTINKILKKLSKIKFVGKIIPNLDESYEVIYMLMKPRYFVVGLGTSIGVAMLEVTGAYLFILGLDGTIIYQDLVVLYNSVTFVSATSMIPAGIGIFEGGIVGLFLLYKMKYEVAFAVTVLIRIVSTAMFTVIGLVALRIVSKEK